MLLTDPTALYPDYPVADAIARFPFGGKDLAVAVVLGAPPTAPCPPSTWRPPIVIDIDSRKGAQIILDNADLPVRAPLVSATNPEVHTL